ADRLLDAVPLGNRDVAAHALERAGGDADHDVVGTLERLALVRRTGCLESDASDLGHVLDELEHARNGLPVDVLDHDIGVDERRHVDEVDEQLRRPLVGPAPDERDLRAHSRGSSPGPDVCVRDSTEDAIVAATAPARARKEPENIDEPAAITVTPSSYD